VKIHALWLGASASVLALGWAGVTHAATAAATADDNSDNKDAPATPGDASS